MKRNYRKDKENSLPDQVSVNYPANPKSGEKAKGKRIDSNSICIRPNKQINKMSADWNKLSNKMKAKFISAKAFWKFQKMTVVKVDLIDTESKLARYMRETYGFGTFRVCFWDRYHWNKKFDSGFICNGRRCKYFNRCIKKNDKNKLKAGMACWNNPRTNRCFATRCILTIKKGSEAGNDFVYEYDEKEFKMFQFWWWIGVDEKELIDEEEGILFAEDDIFDDDDFVV